MLTQAARLKDKDKKKQEQGDGRPRTGRERTLSHTAARSQASEQVTTRYTAPSPRSATTRCLRHPVFNTTERGLCKETGEQDLGNRSCF